jgi:predicted O-methyltransferase YrrM
MTKNSLKQFLAKLSYSTKEDEKFVLDLCAMTKCRAIPEQNSGYESCFLFLALCERLNLTRFLEFGTGRCTTSYIMSIQHNIKRVVTIDITRVDEQRPTWFDYKNVFMSNSQILESCQSRLEPCSIQIEHINNDSLNLKPSDLIKNDKFDIVYIDSNHDYKYVKNDIRLAKDCTSEDSIIILDDYHPNYGVIHAVHEMIPTEELLLVGVNGHIFGPSSEDGTGHIIWPRGKYKELLKNEGIYL